MIQKTTILLHTTCVISFIIILYNEGVLQHIDHKVKGIFNPGTGHGDPEREYIYSYTLSLTSDLDGGGWSKPGSGRLTPGKETCFQL